VIEEKAAKVTHNEEIKEAIPTLAGTIADTINDAGADHFSDDDNQFLKFHGCYQQDDRDLRKTGKKYIMMVRGRIPGGVMTQPNGLRLTIWRQNTPTTRCALLPVRAFSFTVS
jgi:sulfite reductase beta subunit-like hemoprotein